MQNYPCCSGVGKTFNFMKQFKHEFHGINFFFHKNLVEITSWLHKTLVVYRVRQTWVKVNKPQIIVLKLALCRSLGRSKPTAAHREYLDGLWFVSNLYPVRMGCKFLLTPWEQKCLDTHPRGMHQRLTEN